MDIIRKRGDNTCYRGNAVFCLAVDEVGLPYRNVDQKNEIKYIEMSYAIRRKIKKDRERDLKKNKKTIH